MRVPRPTDAGHVDPGGQEVHGAGDEVVPGRAAQVGQGVGTV